MKKNTAAARSRPAKGAQEIAQQGSDFHTGYGFLRVLRLSVPRLRAEVFCPTTNRSPRTLRSKLRIFGHLCYISCLS